MTTKAAPNRRAPKATAISSIRKYKSAAQDRFRSD
jgi:hypothetical protein